MNKHDEIKRLLKASQKMLSTHSSVNEENEIKRKYNLISEQMGADKSSGLGKINVAKSIEKNIDQDEDQDTMRSPRDEKTAAWRISGGILKISGKTTKELQLTEDEKIAFQESMDEFINEVANLVDFNELHIYKNDVTWGGRLNDFDLEFNYRVGEENGVYVKVDNLSKLSNEILEVMEKLKKYYSKFKSKWAEILGNRKMTKVETEE